ncbi:MAG: ribosome biogenesis GTP-binding protein YihA/YsxC [Myxococcota bacterium]
MGAPLILDARFLVSATSHAQLPPPLVAEVAFAGRSNVGKSSLINRLVERKKLVRTSSTPGCTRGINVFRIGVRLPGAEGADRDAELDLVDLPGYGYARRSKAERRSWGPLIEGFLSERPGLRGVVIIVDVRRGLEDDDLQLLDYVRSIERRPILVATKLDKLRKNERKLALEAVGKPHRLRVHGFSSETGEGREALWRTLLRVASVGPAA